MNTRILTLMDAASKDSIALGAEYIRQGQVVAFPTETVYGLGADALNPQAVLRIFEAKGRPADNPLIVHIDAFEDLLFLTAEIPQTARRLAEAFWPGPLTLIFPKSAQVPDAVTAGLPTVAVRIPDHWAARALIRQSGCPIGAPSANRSGRPSPTCADHVWEDMQGRIPLILDGGGTQVGLESTVLDITSDPPVLLRPGGVTLEMLQTLLPQVVVDPGVLAPVLRGAVKSPGMKYQHYAPQAPMHIFRGPVDKLIPRIRQEAAAACGRGETPGILATEETKDAYGAGIVLSMGARQKPGEMAAALFARLREFDRLGVDIIFAEGVDQAREGLAVMNRLARAAGFRIEEAGVE